jgi:molybdopterin/thiamine biosynthesis adenylyltransferase/rhodanese-related sulfurtransferase
VSRGPASLSPQELGRYARHLALPQVGLEGQEKLKAGRVLLVGAGGLGSPAALYLAAAGVGTIGLVDFDTVDASNLHRQLLFGTRDIGRSKLEAAARRLEDVNPHVRVERHEARLTSENALDIVRAYDVVSDGTDNFPTRYLVNDACVLAGKPNVYASVFRFEGQASVFWAAKGPCYRCVYPEPPPPGLVPSCAEGGVLGVLPGLLGLVQAVETIKLLLGLGDSLVGRLLLVDTLSMQFREVKLQKNSSCAVCGKNPTVTKLVDYEAFCGERSPVVSSLAMFGSRVPEITAEELQASRERGEKIVLVDVREPHETAISDLPGSIKIPLGSLPQNLAKIQPSDDVVVYCRSGGRSAQAVKFLIGKGYAKTRNLVGGINHWAEAIDPSMPRY